MQSERGSGLAAGRPGRTAAIPRAETGPKSPVVAGSRRTDRINRRSPVEECFRASYDALNANLRPEAH